MFQYLSKTMPVISWGVPGELKIDGKISTSHV